MKLGLVANYTHSITSFTNEFDIFGNSYNNNNSMQSSQDQNQQQFLYSNGPYTDFPNNNYTSFMNNEYEPFKYPSVQMYPGVNPSLNPINPSIASSFNVNQRGPTAFNNNLRPVFLNDKSSRPRNQLQQQPQPYNMVLKHERTYFQFVCFFMF